MDSPKKTPVIAIVGRTNVGKSTLFNKLIERRKAIVSSVPGTTQDINFGACAWRDRIWTVIDTAGLDFTRQKAEENRIRHQAQMAMDKADLILFVVSAQDGLLPEDLAFAKHLLKSKKPIVFIANKADSPKIRRNALESEWMKTGYGLPWALSATNGTGVGDMLDAVYEIIKDVGEGEELPKPDVKITLIGRPNVGKSSLLNALAGEDRVIVSEIAHTTKEPQDTMLTFIDDHGVTRNLLFVDTVGIRKKANVERGIEKLGVSLSLDQLKNSDVIMIVFDAMVGISMQEKRLLGLAAEKNKSIIIIVNKWDLARDADTDAIIYEKHVQSELPFCKWAPIVFISAKDGRHTSRLPQLALDVVEQHRRIVPQEQLDAFTEKVIKQHHAIAEVGYNKRRPKIYGIVQERTEPPRFTVIVDDEEKLAAGMLGFIENRLRTEFGFNGTDIRMEGRELKKRG